MYLHRSSSGVEVDISECYHHMECSRKWSEYQGLIMEAQHQKHVFVEIKGTTYLVPLERAPNSADLIRIDRRKDYVEGNVMVCSHAAVMLRETYFPCMPFKKFKSLCEELPDNLRNSKVASSSGKRYQRNVGWKTVGIA